MNEDFAPFELAVKLKEKGFNEPCYGYYHRGGGDDSFEVCGNGTYDFLNSKNIHRIAAPTISQVLKWLRVQKDIDIVIYPVNASTGEKKYILTVYTRGERARELQRDNKDEYVKWNDAALAGIEYTLDNLI